MAIPNLFIVGAAKCGTTSLYQYLDQHPEIAMSTWKEPRFFGSDLVIRNDDRCRDMNQYLALFQHAPEAKVLGEATVYYMPSEKAAEEIKAFNPEAKIIIMLRNPVDMMFSWHGQLVWRGAEPLTCFEDALAAEAKRVQGRDIPRSAPFPAAVCYRKMATFSTQVARYLNTFSKDQVKIIIFDDFINQTERIYKEILAFLEVDLNHQADFQVVNAAASKKFRNLRVRSLLRTYSMLQKPLGWIPARYRGKAADWVASITGSQIQRQKQMDPGLRVQLMETFRPDVEKLGAMIDRDLVSQWYDEYSSE
jgi:hypothetical protein